ncbi:MAG: M23 family metallopeptidase [Elusimicrobia bacterium]|nr:M23 family metallopeptidase [Elusimicrobiota bacterium]
MIEKRHIDRALRRLQDLASERQTVLRRLALYGCAALLLSAGLKIKAALQIRAALYDQPYQQVTVFEDDLGADSLREALKESGSDAKETAALFAALKPLGGTGREHRGDSFRVEKTSAGAFMHLTIRRGKKRIVIKQVGTKYEGKVVDPMVVARLHSVRGAIRGNLWLSMSRDGVPAEVISEFADVFQWSVDFLTEVRDGDRYAASWAEERTPDGRVWGREVVAGLYDGKVAGREVGVLFEGDFFNHKGDALESMFLRAPLNYRRISSTFTKGRWHPILRRVRPHHGIDYAAPRGTPVVSIGAGRVVFAGRKGGYGNVVEIRHAGAFETLYGHLNSIGVRRGANVRQGQVIGTVGSTGLSTGPHLHFQIERDGKFINFLGLKIQRARTVPRAKNALFQALLAKRLAALETTTAAKR